MSGRARGENLSFLPPSFVLCKGTVGPNGGNKDISSFSLSDETRARNPADLLPGAQTTFQPGLRKRFPGMPGDWCQQSADMSAHLVAGQNQVIGPPAALDLYAQSETSAAARDYIYPGPSATPSKPRRELPEQRALHTNHNFPSTSPKQNPNPLNKVNTAYIAYINSGISNSNTSPCSLSPHCLIPLANPSVNPLSNAFPLS